MDSARRNSLIKNVSNGIFQKVRRHKSFSEGDGLAYGSEKNTSTPTSVASSRKSSNTNLASPLARSSKPSDYAFLVLDTDPTTHWEEQEDLREPIMEACKIYKKKGAQLLAHTKIIDKFSDDYFDDYLVEMGILDECSLKFEDRMNEIEILRQCQHENIIRFHDAYYHERTLWVRSPTKLGHSRVDFL